MLQIGMDEDVALCLMVGLGLAQKLPMRFWDSLEAAV